ncbi:MAG: hypothetical protein KatS3mg031_2378 [Chitinophagales bacterium]|nr:MAG: hypothetical protein KatS3mg031_2378 [Chitinophagales bacterium]
MTFRLEQILPEPLADQDLSASQIWNKVVEFAPGRCIRLQAASGKGKTTLIHILYGRRTDYSGKVFLNGRQLHMLKGNGWAMLRQRHLAIVFQEMLLFSQLTGRENIHLKSILTGYYDNQTIDAFAERIHAAHLLDKKCGTMSFGERQRIAILRALVQPFDWLLLDEPFSHLDEAHARAASQLIQEECGKQQAGILITTLGEDDFFQYDETYLV